MKRALCIALHDVAPATWPRCERLLALLDAIGASAITLLVVPDFHRRGAAERDPAFIDAIEARRARGDEIALHGYAHVDESAPPRSPSAWFRRRILTDAEGEFSALDRNTAAQRIAAGRDMLARIGWHVDGFVPPAWLASRGTREALADSDLLYTSTHTALVDLRGGMALDAPSITASPRSAWRRAMSKHWLRAARWTTRASGIVRAGLHPADADHPDLLEVWRSLLLDWLREREPMTKRDAVVQAHFRFDDRPVAVRRHAALNGAMQDRGSVAIVLLAAGEASRFGSPKQIASIGERAMVRHCAINALGTQAPVLVVTGAHRDAVETALGGLHVALVHNVEWSAGMGASIARGVRAARERNPGLRGVLVALADQPSVSTGNLSMLLREHGNTPEQIVASRFGERVGAPCVFPASCFGELESLSGPSGARSVIERHGERCRAVELPAAAHDIDTREDYLRFVEQAGLPHS